MYVSHVPLGADATQNAASLTTAIEQASTLGGGKVSIDAGTFEADTILLRSNVLLEGAGMDATVLVQAETLDDSYGMLHAQSSGTGTFVESITIRDLTLRNEVGTFSELIHLLALSGVRDALIERVKFQGFQGDGLILHGYDPGDFNARHNVNVTVRDCVFDGVNHQNRQGITIIDCDGLTIDNCRFVDCTTSTMPGAIDFEPDGDVNVVRNATINACEFQNVGGNVGTISLVFGNLATLPTGFSITNNFFNDYAGTGADISLFVYRNATISDPDMAVLIQGNAGSNGNMALFVRDGKGIRSIDNVWQDYAGQGIHMGADGTPVDVAIADRFVRCGATAAYGAQIFNVDGLRLTGTEFIDCGTGVGDACAIYFHTGTSDHVDLRGVRVEPGTKTRFAVLKNGSHTFTPENNRQRGFVAPDLITDFVAWAPDELLPMVELTWNPPSLADGTGVGSSAVTITGAAFGDTVTVGAPYDLQGLICTGYVSAIRLQNETGGTVDLASGDWSVTVTKALVPFPRYS